MTREDGAPPHPSPGAVVPPSTGARSGATTPGSTRATTVQSLSVGLATGAYGVSFGALAVASGFSSAQALGLSALMFTGGSQFALVGVVASGGSGAAAASSAALLGVRNAFYGVQLAPVLRSRGATRLLAAHVTIDESTAVSAAQPTPALQRLGFWATGLAVLTLWCASTLLGALLGDALGDPRRWGLDAAAVGAFLALLWPRLRRGEVAAVAVVAALLALVAVPTLPPGIPVLVAVLAVPLVLALRRGGAAR